MDPPRGQCPASLAGEKRRMDAGAVKVEEEAAVLGMERSAGVGTPPTPSQAP